MAGCKLTKSLDSKACEYTIAGVRAVYLANFHEPVTGEAAVDGAIAYQTDADGYISKIMLPEGESFYKIEGKDSNTSFTDALLAGGNGGKYRQHTLNTVLDKLDVDVLNEGDALSLGKFVAIVIDNAGRIVILGRTNGLSAPAGGFDYNSGTAEADATGWTTIFQGPSTEMGKLLKDATVITPVYKEVVKP